MSESNVLPIVRSVNRVDGSPLEQHDDPARAGELFGLSLAVLAMTLPYLWIALLGLLLRGPRDDTSISS